MAGIAILLIFIIIALFAPLIAPNHPIKDTFLAESYAVPVWFKAFPEYSNLPPNINLEIPPILSGEGWAYHSSGHVEAREHEASFRFKAEKGIEASVKLTHTFDYKYDPPESLMIEGSLTATEIMGGSINVTAYLETPSGIGYRLWSKILDSPVSQLQFSYSSKTLSSEEKLGMGLQWYENVASFMMAEEGVYRITLWASFNPVDRGVASLAIEEFRIHIPGLAFGPLGTDHIGADLFSQLVYGSRISLLIGITASLIATFLGVMVGVAAGYLGATTDEGLMRLVDLLLVLPFLPLLMVISGIFGKNIWNLILLLGALSWPGFARVVRAKTLQLKESTFVEASKAMGASSWHVAFKHIVLNVIPYMYAVIALSIPGFVVTEAALSFLALGDPSTPSWGRMFYTANAFGAFRSLAWWWIIPPGIAITMLSLSFVFIGHALDEVMNPRLRARR